MGPKPQWKSTHYFLARGAVSSATEFVSLSLPLRPMLSCHSGLLKVEMCFYSQQVLLKLSSIIEEGGMLENAAPFDITHISAFMRSSFVLFIPLRQNPYVRQKMHLLPWSRVTCLISELWSLSGHVYFWCDFGGSPEISRWAAVRDALIMSESSRQRAARFSSACEMMRRGPATRPRDSIAPVKLSNVLFDGL